MKRLSGWLIVLAATLFLCTGCDIVWSTDDTPAKPVADEPAYTYLADYQHAWYYRQLSNRLQMAYTSVYEAVMAVCDQESVIRIDGANEGTTESTYGVQVSLYEPLLSQEETTLLYNAFTRDNPQFFYIGNTYRCEGYTRGKQTYYDTVFLTFTLSAKQRTAANTALEQALTEWLRDLPAATNIDTELVLHDRLIDRCSYHQTAADDAQAANRYPAAFTAYGALVNHQAVCEGYARGLQLLLHRMGIDSTVVTGTTRNNEPHMWNVVTVADQTYHVDATWDDSGDRLRHTFFNLSDEEIAATHTMDDENAMLPTCEAIQAGYYRYTGRYVDDYDRDVIAAVIARDVREKRVTVDLRFSPDTYTSARLFLASFDEVAARVNGQLQGDNVAMWPYEYTFNDTYHTITLYKIA